MARPVVFPKKKDLREDIVFGVARTLGLTSKQMRERVEGPSKKKSKSQPNGKLPVQKKTNESPEATI